jgi:predicted lipid-binding transport protein (Tim44 family)
MRLIFGFVALLIVLAVIGTLGKTQLSVLGLTGSATTRSANQGTETKAVTDAVMGRARDGAATIAVPGDMGGMAGAAPAVADVTVPMQAQAIQNRVRDQTNAALQKGADRSNASQP